MSSAIDDNIDSYSHDHPYIFTGILITIIILVAGISIASLYIDAKIQFAWLKHFTSSKSKSPNKWIVAAFVLLAVILISFKINDIYHDFKVKDKDKDKEDDDK